MSVSSRAVGWVTGALPALGGTAFVLLAEDPRTTGVRLLAVGGVLLSSAVGGWTAWMIHRGAPEPGEWSAAVPCVVIGALFGVVTFLLLCVIALVVAVIAFVHSNPVW